VMLPDFKIPYIYVNSHVDSNSNKRYLNIKLQYYCTQIGS
jgi:hypothetical protein